MKVTNYSTLICLSVCVVGGGVILVDLHSVLQVCLWYGNVQFAHKTIFGQTQELPMRPHLVKVWKKNIIQTVKVIGIKHCSQALLNQPYFH